MTDVVTVELGPASAEQTRRLRDALGCFATGVTIVTCQGEDGRPVGLTVNAFTSVSLDPPLVLVCIDGASRSLPAFEAAGAFAVNVLRAGQEDTAWRFTLRDGERFEGTVVETWAGAPILGGCLANFECVVDKAFDAGDHRVIIGRVEKLRYDASGAPLLFLGSRFRELAESS
jgi:flavin reductase (DIM6/NTAB) family NADH-FMN oxidoreductase RutF